MPRASVKPPRIAPGVIFEYRVCRLRFWQGYFVRRSIDVWPESGEPSKLAELDCLAAAFDPQFRRSVEVMECKTSEGGQKEIDRVVWLRGVGQLAAAQSVTFAKANLAPRTRDLARRLQVDVLDEQSLVSAERELGIRPDTWIGFHDPEFGESVVKSARIALTSSEELRRVGRYLFGTYWFTEDFTRIKQLRTLYGLLSENSASMPRDALSLGIAEATVLLAIAIFSIASWRNQRGEADFRRLVSDELSTGLGNPRGLRTLLRRIDDLRLSEIESLHSAYQASGAGRAAFPTRNLESEILTPPEWVDAFVDLVTRFSQRPHLATDFLRWLDLWAAELVGAPLGLGSAGALFRGRERELQSMTDLLLAFLTRVWGVPTHLIGRGREQRATPKQLALDHDKDGEDASSHNRTPIPAQPAGEPQGPEDRPDAGELKISPGASDNIIQQGKQDGGATSREDRVEGWMRRTHLQRRTHSRQVKQRNG